MTDYVSVSRLLAAAGYVDQAAVVGDTVMLQFTPLGRIRFRELAGHLASLPRTGSRARTAAVLRILPGLRPLKPSAAEVEAVIALCLHHYKN